MSGLHHVLRTGRDHVDGRIAGVNKRLSDTVEYLSPRTVALSSCGASGDGR